MTRAHDRKSVADDTEELQPLSAHRLAVIWRSLPEHERFAFVLALDEIVANRVIAETHRLVQAQELAVQHSTAKQH